jgi:hypothetical protein
MSPIRPPKAAGSELLYAPRTKPIIGAMTAAAVMAFPGKPIIGEISMKPKTA